MNTDLSAFVGTVANPLPYASVENGGLTMFFTNVLRLVFVIAGIYAFINLILAGFAYMSAGGDSKAMAKAWDKIWQTLLGLAIIAGSFVIAAVVGFILFNDPMFLMKFTVYGPK
jgi:hypothetical protein